MPLTLLRHTTPNRHQGLCYGRLDLDLADTFAAEAQRALAALGKVTAIHSSPLSRCMRLAEFIAEKHELSVLAEPRLIEMDFGRWEGLLWSHLPREELDAWAEDFMHARPHGGESVAMLRERVLSVLDEISKDRSFDAALCVTHSGVIKAAMARGDQSTDFDLTVAFGGSVAWSPIEDCV